MSNPNEWLHMYQQNLSNQTPLLSVSDHEMNNNSNHSRSTYADHSLVSDATIITTTTTVNTTSPPTSASGLSPDGRVGKPVRRRSRASRRTPTTLLNTDAANFRAMVQQFTGGPSHSTNAPNFPFGFANSRPIIDPTTVMVSPGGYHLHPQQQPQMFQFQNQQTTQPPFMFSLNNNSSNVVSEAFHQTHGGSGSRPVNYMGFPDGPSFPPSRPP